MQPATEWTAGHRRGLRDLSDPAMPAELGVDLAPFGQLPYGRHRGENPRTQEIAEVARFLDFDGLSISNARWACTSIVVFCDAIASGGLAVRRDHGLVDWADGQSRRGGRLADLRWQ